MSILDLSPKRQDLKWARGDTWQVRFSFLDANSAPIDLSGSTWLMQVRANTPDGTLFGTFTVATSAQASGYIDVELDEVVTKTAVPGATYWYDIQQTKGGDVVTPVGGKIVVVADTSKVT